MGPSHELRALLHVRAQGPATCQPGILHRGVQQGHPGPPDRKTGGAERLSTAVSAARCQGGPEPRELRARAGADRRQNLSGAVAGLLRGPGLHGPDQQVRPPCRPGAARAADRRAGLAPAPAGIHGGQMGRPGPSPAGGPRAAARRFPAGRLPRMATTDRRCGLGRRRRGLVPDEPGSARVFPLRARHGSAGGIRRGHRLAAGRAPLGRRLQHLPGGPVAERELSLAWPAALGRGGGPSSTHSGCPGHRLRREAASAAAESAGGVSAFGQGPCPELAADSNRNGRAAAPPRGAERRPGGPDARQGRASGAGSSSAGGRGSHWECCRGFWPRRWASRRWC